MNAVLLAGAAIRVRPIVISGDGAAIATNARSLPETPTSSNGFAGIFDERACQMAK
jgi:hypothetical protein